VAIFFRAWRYRFRPAGWWAFAALLAACGSDIADDDAGCREAVLSPELHRIEPPSWGNVNLIGVSFDGAVVVGRMSTSASAIAQSFRWTETAGVKPLGFLGNHQGAGTLAVSADGTAVVGTAPLGPSTKRQPSRWTESGGMMGLGVGNFEFDEIWTAGVSGDGSVVAGGVRQLSAAGIRMGAFRWAEGSGMTDLDTPAGAFGATATNVSADGSTIIGDSFNDDFTRTKAFRWTERTGSVHLDGRPDAVTSALFVSNDGSVIVGVAGAQGVDIAFRWTERTGFVALGPLGGFTHSRPTGMSADGSVVVGVCTSPDKGPLDRMAFHWEDGRITALPLFPRDIPYRGNQAVGVSSDGSTVVGLDEAWTGENTGGYSSDVVVWKAQGCPTRVRPASDDAKLVYSPSAISGDARTIIGSATRGEGFSTGWVVRVH
jgi:uncharacterized membrane protein